MHALTAQHVDCGEDGGDVLALVVAAEWECELQSLGSGALPPLGGGDGLERGVLLFGKCDCGVALLGLSREHVAYFALRLPYHHGYAGLDDAGFFRCDLGQGVAEELRMVF